MKLNSRIIPLLILASFIFLSGCTFPEVPVCGNNICEAPTENSNTCAVDCSGTPQPENRYYEGKFIKNLEGTGTYTGQEMSVKLTTILQSGASANRYAATFELYDSNGNLIDTRTVYTGDNLKNEFLDKNAKPALATSIEVIRIAVESTTGRGFVDVTITFEDKPPRTEIEIGNKITGLDSSSKGGLQFRADNDFLRQIPFYLKLSDTNAGNTFTFEGKNVWYSMRFATGTGGKDTPFDYNVLVNSGDYVNGRQWIVGSNSITVLGISASDNFLSTGDIFNIDNVSYKINSIVNGRVSVSVDAAVQFRLYNYTGTLIYNTAGDTTDATYGLLFLSNNKTFDTANKLNIPEKIPVTLPLYTQESVRPVYYAVKYNNETDKLWLLLEKQTLNAANGNKISFNYTRVPNNPVIINAIPYYVPKDTEFDSSPLYSSNLDFNAVLNVFEAATNKTTIVYVDTGNGSVRKVS